MYQSFPRSKIELCMIRNYTPCPRIPHPESKCINNQRVHFMFLRSGCFEDIATKMEEYIPNADRCLARFKLGEWDWELQMKYLYLHFMVEQQLLHDTDSPCSFPPKWPLQPTRFWWSTSLHLALSIHLVSAPTI